VTTQISSLFGSHQVILLGLHRFYADRVGNRTHVEHFAEEGGHSRPLGKLVVLALGNGTEERG